MIDIVPTTPHLLQETLDWLKSEEEKDGAGFFCKKDMIVESQENDEMYCGVYKGMAVGFVVHSITENRGAIDLLEVHPQYRRRRIGTKLAANAVERLRNAEAMMIRTQCRPRIEHFWLKLGFARKANTVIHNSEPLRLILNFEA